MVGVCSSLNLSEDNARILLLGVVLLLYMFGGAMLFHQTESEAEAEIARRYWALYHEFRAHLVNASVSPTRLDQLLYEYGNATALGVINKRTRWDISGSLHFVFTLVSTIGWGGTVPLTTAGRVLVILYGFLACSGGILFFNLFLERVITLLAYILRLLYIRDLRKRKGTEIHDMDIHQDLEEWKPSVYWVLVCLATMSAVVGSFGGWLYSTHENWSYFEAVYYCFVSFSTIGLGDYVSGEGHANEPLYSVLSFIVISLGSCCTYSLFNVLSIIIKQFLNWLIWHLDCHCFDRETDKGDRMLRRHSIRFQREQRERRRRSSLTVPKTIRRTRKGGAGGAPSSISNNNEEGEDVDSDSGGAEPGRRLSGEMISMKGLVCGNKVNLAVMQKQLYETAQMSRGGGGYDRSTHFGPGTVGPLAIVSHKFGEK